MHKTIHHKKEPFNIDINAAKGLVIVISVFIFFVIPAQVITLYNEKKSEQEIVNVADDTQTNQEGRVAGASTQRSNGYKFSLQDKNTQYVLIGGFFGMIALLSLGYFLLESKSKTEADKYYKF